MVGVSYRNSPCRALISHSWPISYCLTHYGDLQRFEIAPYCLWILSFQLNGLLILCDYNHYPT